MNLILHDKKLIKLLNGQRKLLLFIDEEDCQSCIIQLFMDADLTIPNIIESKLVIVGNYKNENRFDNILSLIPGQFPSINVYNNKTLHKLGYSTPSMVVITKDFKFKFFHPFDEVNLSNSYFNIILKSYFTPLGKTSCSCKASE